MQDNVVVDNVVLLDSVTDNTRTAGNIVVRASEGGEGQTLPDGLAYL